MITDGLKNIAQGFKSKFNRETVSSTVGNPRNATRQMRQVKVSPAKALNLKKPSIGKVGTVNSAFYTKVSSGQNPRLKKGDTLADIPAKLFNLIRKNQEDKKLLFEIYRDIDRPMELRDEKIQHDEIIKALNARRKRTEELEKTTQEAKENYEKSKAEADKVVKEAKEKAAASTQTVPTAPINPTKPAGTPASPVTTPSATPPAVSTKPNTATKQQTVPIKPPPSAKPAEPITPGAAPATATQTTPSIPASTAIKTGVVAAGALAATSSIAGAESGGNYDITFGDKLDKKKNVVRGPNMSPEKLFGKKLVDLTLEEVDTLGKERNKNSPSTSAMGKYQFMNSTLFGRKDKKGVFRPGLVQQSGLDMKTTKFTPEIQDKFFQMLHEQDLTTLKRLGVPVTPGYGYMAHYIGAGGVKAIYDRKDSNMTVQQALIDAKLPDPVSGTTNAELATIKASEFESVLQNRLNKNGLNSPHAAATPESMPKTMGNKLNGSSIEYKDNKGGQGNTVFMDNTQTNIVNGATKKAPQSFVQPTAPDLPMYQQLGK